MRAMVLYLCLSSALRDPHMAPSSQEALSKVTEPFGCRYWQPFLPLEDDSRITAVSGIVVWFGGI